MASDTRLTGAHVIAKALHDLGVSVIFGIVGIPVVEVAEEAINLGIRFIGCRNEQTCGYAASVYGYLTGRPGVCLVVGGPGVLNAMAGIGNSFANGFPMLLLAGSNESHLVTKGAFQELDAVALLAPHTKFASRPPSLDAIPQMIHDAYRHAWYGRPGATFVDLPADLIQGIPDSPSSIPSITPVPNPPLAPGDNDKIAKIAAVLKQAKSPLVVIGKGCALARAEGLVRQLIDTTSLPFLPSPMGKGVVPDSHKMNASSARSTALKEADIVLVLGARLNWIFHFGEAPKWNPRATFVQVDIAPEEIGRNRGDASLSVVGDVGVVVSQLLTHLQSWQYNTSNSSYVQHLESAKRANTEKATQSAQVQGLPLSIPAALTIIKDTLHTLDPENNIVYVSEGANTMDQSRSIFPVEHPRARLDAGTYATMGVGMGYCLAAHEAHNSSNQSNKKKTKIVALEGDSAFGFSAMDFETLTRYGMDVLIFVMNNGGVYHGDSDDASEWERMRRVTADGKTDKGGLRSTSLGYAVRYDQIATACGGKGYLVQSPEELEKATREGFQAKVPVIVNVMVKSGKGGTLQFGWQASNRKPTKL